MIGAALKAAYAEAKPGCCPYCDAPLKQPQGCGRKRKICGSRECSRAWFRDYSADNKRRKLGVERPIVQRERVNAQRVRFTLDCGHVVERHQSCFQRQRAVYCAACLAERRSAA